jgi:hypothetical protein
LFETRHLARKIGGRHGAEVLWMTPCVGGDLMTGLVSVLEGRLLSINATCSC